MKGSLRPRSVRVRLTLWYAGALAAILVLYAGGVFIFLRHSLSSELNSRLHDDFEFAEQMIGVTAQGDIHWTAGEHHEEKEEAHGRWVEVWSRDGTLLYRNPPPEGGEMGFLPFFPAESYEIRSIQLPGDVPFRILTGPYVAGGHPVVVRVARSEEGFRKELRELLLILGLALPLAVVIAGVGGIILSRRALAPVAAMADRAGSITAERLGERLPVENPDDELGHLAAVFNETFARLERSFEQLRRFTADASHELRTPLTAIRSVGEVGLRHVRDAKAYREIIGSMLEEADRLGRLVDSLLTLSRADAGHLKLNPEPVDLVELSREVVNHLGVLAEEKRQSVSVEATSSVHASVDRLVFRQAVINLLDNAIKYSPEGASIRIVATDQPRGPALEVIDNGPGIAAVHRQRIFDRFYRVDKARSRDLGGSGLGLAISLWAVQAHGGHIELDTQEGRGSTFRITVPRKHSTGS